MSLSQSCQSCHKVFEHAPEDESFYLRLSPIIAGTKYPLPLPRHCPECRHQRRLLFRNERYLFRLKCFLTGRSIVSSYPPETGLKIVQREAWLDIDNEQFGRDFDFNRPFFEQFRDLSRETYKASLIQGGNMENSDYAHFCGWLKNCYWLFDSGKSEDCLYGVTNAYSRNCLDCQHIVQCELCYESYKLDNCYDVRWSAYAKNCSASAFLHDCIGCKNCIGCTNLRNKSYYLFNRPASAEEYQQLWERLASGSVRELAKIQERYKELFKHEPHRAAFLINSVDSSGDNLINCENVIRGFDCSQVKDSRYCYELTGSTEQCADISTFGEDMENCYQLSAAGGAMGKARVSNCYFSSYIYYGGYNILYSQCCHENSSELFGCSDLRKKQYCILNKQYSKAEYERLLPKIIAHMQRTGEWGEFFPPQVSTLPYNYSLASEDFPLSKAEAQAYGSSWSDYQNPVLDIKGSIPAESLPDSLEDIQSDICEQAIICAETAKPFKITPAELAWYRQQGVPLPRIHPEVRIRKRLEHRRRRELSEIPCSDCKKPIYSTYNPTAGLRICCGECFQQVVD